MAFVRADTSHTMASRSWSTSELIDGLENILGAGKNELPDEIAQLEA